MKKKDRALEQAEALVERMTIEEAASQLRYISPAIERLGIPAYNWWNEALHGVARAGTATVFPQAIGLAAMFDPDRLRETAAAVAVEARAKYNEQKKRGDRDIFKGITMWSPNINIFRDPRWGRGQETYGEDPYLTSRMGVAFVEGLQGDGEYLTAAACAKHYAVHSGPEKVRHGFNAVCSVKDMRETYLPAFEALVREAKVEGVMGAYNRVNGEGACASEFLMNELKDWGFDGYFTSDAWALRDFHGDHKLTETVEQSAALALGRGCDLNCGTTYLSLMDAYAQGLVNEEQIRTACVHLFRTRFRLGMFDEDSGFETLGIEDVATAENHAAAMKCAEKSMVLLKNDGILPLNADELKSVAVIGPNADSIDALRGNYYGTMANPVTFLEGIRRELDGRARVYYSEGSSLCRENCEFLSESDDRLAEAEAMIQKADVTILCVGLDATIEGEEGDEGNAYIGGDKTTLELPDCQKNLIEKAMSAGKPVVVVIASGSSLNVHAEKAAAVLQAWYPGEAGGEALANILFGRTSPSGKLPVTFYESADLLPEFEDYSMKNRTYRYAEGNILYPFGYGLTYSKTEISGFEMDGSTASVTVSNTGDFDTDEVVQIYIRDLDSPDEVRNCRLCAFRRISLKAGDSKTVRIPVSGAAFTVVDDKGNRKAGSGRYRLWAGVSQPDELSGKLCGCRCASLDFERK